MKTFLSGLTRAITLLSLVVCMPSLTRAQTRPSLGLTFSAGRPLITVTGIIGTVYSIQYTTNLSPTGHWTDRTLLRVKGASISWTDPDAPTTSQKFYRALSVAAPADGNLVFIEPGTFMMGSPTNEALRDPGETQHTVTISRGFWMGKYLVTQGDYLSVAGSNPSYFTSANGYSDDLTRPVEQVSWYDATTNYCSLRTQQEQTAGLIPTNFAYRLPTESEWEYCCRAGTTTAYYLGTGLHSEQANFDGRWEYDSSIGTTSNPSGIKPGTTTPVGSYPPNPWGLYDMIGNTDEWCQDVPGDYPGTVIDPQGPASGSYRVFRGGDFNEHASDCRSAIRNGLLAYLSLWEIGFRIVLAQRQ